MSSLRHEFLEGFASIVSQFLLILENLVESQI